jgi:hypothetical protein
MRNGQRDVTVLVWCGRCADTEGGQFRVPGNDHVSAGLGRLLEREYGLDCGTRKAASDSWRKS